MKNNIIKILRVGVLFSTIMTLNTVKAEDDKNNSNNNDNSTMLSSIGLSKENVGNFFLKGRPEVLISVGSYHDRNYYSKSSIDSFNERNEGYGLGWIYHSEAKNEHSIKFLKISDSNYHSQYLLGYQYMYNIWKTDADIQLGLMTGITKRAKDNGNYFYAPFALPAVGVKYKNVKLNLTYMPEMKYQGEKFGGFAYAWLSMEF